MKKYFKHLSMAAIATFAFAACEEVPELPYQPGGDDNDSTEVVTGDNLLENGDFETWESSEPTHWKSTTTASSATLDKSTDAHSGTYAVLVQGDAEYNKRLAYKEITLNAGTYYITFYAKAASDTEASVRPGYVGVLSDGKADSQNYKYGNYVNNITNTEWTEVKHEFTLDTQKTINLIIMNPKSTASDVLIDDYSLTTTNGSLVEDGGNNDDTENEVPDSLLQTSTIAQVLADGAGKRVKVEATAVATYARGFLLNDGTGYILVYLNEDKGYVAGDVVTVIGNISEYAGLLQFPKESIVEKIGTAEVTHPTPTSWDGTDMDTYLSAPSVNYVEYTGMLNISGNYYNIEVEGANTAVGSISYPAGEIADAASALNGKKIAVTGYSIGVSSNKYVNTMALSITTAEGNDEPGNEDPVEPTGDNLIGNGDFEAWSGSTPTNWQTTTTAGNASLSQSSDAHAGSYAVQVGGSTSANKRLGYQEITLTAGTYHVQFYTKAATADGGSARPGYTPVGEDGKVGQYVYGDYVNDLTTDAWTEVNYEFTLTEQSTINLVVMCAKNPGAPILVDDYSLTTTDGALVEGGNESGEDTPDTPADTKTIAEVLAAGAGAAKVQATIVATYARGFLLNDGTGYILTYLGEDKGYVAGDVVTVSGDVTTYGGLLQFPNSSVVEKVGTAEVTHPEVSVWDGADMDKYLEGPSVQYIQYTGTLSISGYYYNVNIDGASTAVGSIAYPAEGLVDPSLDGKEIVVTGYAIGFSGSKYVNTMALTVEAAN